MSNIAVLNATSTPNPKYVCNLCNKGFLQKNDLARHKQKKTPCISMDAIQQLAERAKVKSDDKKELIDVFKCCENILRDSEGLTGDKALRNWSHLLILKMMEPHLGNTIDIDNHSHYDFSHIEDDCVESHRDILLETARFSKLATMNSLDVFARLKYLWDDILSEHPSTRNIFLKGKGFDIQYATTFKKLIDKLNSIDLAHADYDVLGEAYEQVIQSVMRGKVLGQFFTQPMVKKLMVSLVDPRVFTDGTIETCCDPTMGTGGFLVSYLKDVTHKASLQGIELNWDFIKGGLHGKEIEPDTFQLAVSNMMLSSGHTFDHLERGDSIRSPIDMKFDIVLANPPFGIKGLKYDEFASPIKDAYVPIRTDNAVSLFLQAIVYMLKHNGRCAVVLPDGQDLFSKTNATLIAVREYLLKTCDLKEIIYLPPDSFTNTSVKTCVFFFVKKREGTEVLEVTKKMSKTHRETGRSYKFTKTHQTSHVKFYDYNPYEEIKRLLVEVPIERIANNCYSLNYSEYLEEDKEEELADGVVMKTLGEVLGKKTTNFIPVEDEKKYNVVGLSAKGLSKVTKKMYGKDIKMKRQQVCDTSQFALSKILNGCHGFIDEKTANGIMSSEYWLFDVQMDVILIEYLKYIFEPQILPQLKTISNGVGIPRIDLDKFYNLKIPVPPLERQREIVDYLDFVYEQCVKTSRDKIEQLKRLNAMCLTNQRQFGENVVKTLGEVCEVNQGSSLTKTEIVKGEYDVIGGGKIIGKHHQFNRGGNEITLTRVGDININYIEQPYYLTDNGFSIKSNIETTTRYIYQFVSYNAKCLTELYKGSAQKVISKTSLKSIQIPIPSLERQQEIVDYCEANDALIASLEAEIERNKQQANQFLAMMVKGKTLEEHDIQETIGEESANAVEEEQEPEQEENM